MKELLGTVFYIGLALLFVFAIGRCLYSLIKAARSGDYRWMINQSLILILCLGLLLLLFGLELEKGVVKFGTIF